MTTRIRKPKEIDTTDKIKCSRCKVWKTKEEFKTKRKTTDEPIVYTKYCDNCLRVSSIYRNKKKIIKVNIHNLSDEEKKEIFEEVNNISE